MSKQLRNQIYSKSIIKYSTLRVFMKKKTMTQTGISYFLDIINKCKSCLNKTKIDCK